MESVALCDGCDDGPGCCVLLGLLGVLVGVLEEGFCALATCGTYTN